MTPQDRYHPHPMVESRPLLERLLNEVGERAVVEFRPRMEGNTLHAILAPKKTEKEREKEKQREEKHKAAAQSAPSALPPQVAKPAS